jgi:PAS domain-containing protein
VAEDYGNKLADAPGRFSQWGISSVVQEKAGPMVSVLTEEGKKLNLRQGDTLPGTTHAVTWIGKGGTERGEMMPRTLSDSIQRSRWVVEITPYSGSPFYLGEKGGKKEAAPKFRARSLAEVQAAYPASIPSKEKMDALIAQSELQIAGDPKWLADQAAREAFFGKAAEDAWGQDAIEEIMQSGHHLLGQDPSDVAWDQFEALKVSRRKELPDGRVRWSMTDGSVFVEATDGKMTDVTGL